MSPRTLIRNVTHRITQHPDIGLTYEAACLSCGWSAEPSPDGGEVDVECLRHAGRSNHRGFRRTAHSYAHVVRDGEDPVTASTVPPHPSARQ
ncbi:DUF7848 domain-containing protein [Streptomyces atratus]|uniref:DUF7848 domain-containing protein n=1 Tax=Streptomyces atratus TaxID=1893 RepID=A0A1K2C908_STRAR|nr:hypothetical protein SAMN02787144_1010105 [Streptomyces atratus]